ncbi:hypothetical protein [Paraglaciecola aestuariivivens]
MKTFELPKSIACLVNELHLVEMVWQGVPVQIPHFAVYAIIHQPLFKKVLHKENRKVGLLKFQRYNIPVIDPFYSEQDFSPNYALIMSHSRGDQFGLYGYPADHIETDICIDSDHPSVNRIVRDYL